MSMFMMCRLSWHCGAHKGHLVTERRQIWISYSPLLVVRYEKPNLQFGGVAILSGASQSVNELLATQVTPTDCSLLILFLSAGCIGIMSSVNVFFLPKSTCEVWSEVIILRVQNSSNTTKSTLYALRQEHYKRFRRKERDNSCGSEYTSKRRQVRNEDINICF